MTPAQTPSLLPVRCNYTITFDTHTQASSPSMVPLLFFSSVRGDGRVGVGGREESGWTVQQAWQASGVFFFFFWLIWTKWCLILKTQLLYLDGRPLKQSEGKMPVIALAVITEYHRHYHSVFTRLAYIGFMLFCQPLKMDNTVGNVWFLEKKPPTTERGYSTIFVAAEFVIYPCCESIEHSASYSKPSGRLKQTAEGEAAQPVIKLWKMPSAVHCSWLIQIYTWPAAPGGRLSWKQMTNMGGKKGSTNCLFPALHLSSSGEPTRTEVPS